MMLIRMMIKIVKVTTLIIINYDELTKGVVSKETVVLRRWGSSIQKFGFINGVDNVNWPLYRDSKSSVRISVRISVRWPIYIINSVDKTKFLYTMN